jgi:bacterioferritin-associated ferredoxin
VEIDRCVCFNRRFSELRRVAERSGVRSVEALQQHVAFGLKCGLCRPYVRRMLRTGETVFTEVIEEED